MKKISQMATSSALILAAASAQAYVSGGHEYDSSCNNDGYVLTSKYPVARTLGTGAQTQVLSGIEKLYLGRDCDAYHPLFGEGQWCWANGGFVADFGDASFGFARQELYCSADENIGLNCGC